MPVYDVEAPDGRKLRLEGPEPPSDAELDEIFSSSSGSVQKMNDTGGIEAENARQLQALAPKREGFGGFLSRQLDKPFEATVPGTRMSLGNFLNFAPLSRETWTGEPPEGAVAGTYEGIAKQVTPLNAATIPAAGAALLSKAVHPLVKTILGAYFAQHGGEMVGQQAELATRPQALSPELTPGQRAEAGVNMVVGALMGLSPLAVGKGLRPTSRSGIVEGDFPPAIPTDTTTIWGLPVERSLPARTPLTNFRESVRRPTQASPAIVGEDPILMRRAARIEDGPQILPGWQAAGEAKQGGQVSFAAEAQAGGVPSARQQAVEPRFQGVSVEEALARAEQEAGQPLNPGGSPESLSPELRALSDRNNSREAFARAQAEADAKTQGGAVAEPAYPEKPAMVADPFQMLDPEFWEGLGLKSGDAGQFYNRIRNKLGEGSAAWEMVKDTLPKVGRVTQEEVRKAVEEGGPRVEVRKSFLGEGQKQRQHIVEVERRMNAAQHQLETQGFRTTDTGLMKQDHTFIEQGNQVYEYGPNHNLLSQTPIESYPNRLVRDYLSARREYNGIAINEQPGSDVHWQSISPKPEAEMEGYVELAVVKSLKKELKSFPEKSWSEAAQARRDLEQEAGVQFPSSHNYPPNTLVFVRGYMDKTPDGKKVFNVIEVQSDWGQKVRTDKALAKDLKVEKLTGQPFDDPLLRDYNRLGVKAAIEHAREQGAEGVVFHDAPTVMMMEGHDLYSATHQGNAPISISQEPGMRLNYDKILPKIAEELTGSKGERVSMGEHRNAFEKTRTSPWELVDENGNTVESFATQGEAFTANAENYKSEYRVINREGLGEPRENLIFDDPNDPSGTGKQTQIKGVLFPLENVREKFTLTGSDKARTPTVKSADEGQPGIFDAKDGDRWVLAKNTDPKNPGWSVHQLQWDEGQYKPAARDDYKTWQEARDSIGDLRQVDEDGKTKKGIAASVRDVPSGREEGAVSLEPLRDMAKAVKDVVATGINAYAEPLIERLGRIGGPVAKKVSEEAGQIVSEAKKSYGGLTPVLDPAKQAAGSLGRDTTWIRGIDNVTERSAISKVAGAIEDTISIPSYAMELVHKLRKANLAIGNLATQAVASFVASGKMQRMLSNYGMDVIRRGGGKAWTAWTEGLAKANQVSLADTQTFFHKWKKLIDEPGVDMAAIDRINQDFTRVYPKAITHIKPGVAWHEVVISDPFTYLEQAAQRTAHAVAFRKTYPPGSGLLAKTREMVSKEVETGRYSNEFDNLIRALQGHPTDSFTSWWNAPDSPIGGVSRMANTLVGGPIKALVLTGNALTNLGEVISGGPSIFLGYKNVFGSMSRLGTLYSQLELNGALNRNMFNYAYDPKSPVRSAARIGGNVLRRTFLEQALNEVQEAQGASAAKVVADKARANALTPYERERMTAVMRAMGIDEAMARNAVSGKDQVTLSEFERRASAFLSAGNQAMAEKSRLGTSRAFNELFWFHSYPQMAMNQIRRVGGNFIEDVGTKNWPQAKHNVILLGRQLGGRTLQGALTIGVLALAYEGIHGAKERKQEAKDEPLEFLRDSYLAAMGGPLYLMKRTLENSGSSAALQQTIGATITPYGLAGELYDASLGNGRYEGRTPFERTGMFVESKTPGWKAIKTGMSLFGLSKENRELTTAEKAFYRWRVEEMGWTRRVGNTTEQEGKEFRVKMRRAVDALENGQDWKKELADVNEADAGRSMFARTLLKTPEGKPLSEEQLTSLRNRIGSGLVDTLQARDAMVRQIGRELGETKNITKVTVAPKGLLAVDFTTETQRKHEVEKRLDKSVVDFLTANKLNVPGFTPSVKYGKTERKLTKNEVSIYEEAFAGQLNLRLKRLVERPDFGQLPEKQQRRLFDYQVDLARDRATSMTRARVSRQPPQ